MILRGFGQGRPLLWIHGLGESSLCFESVLTQPALQAYRHWLLDLPGYGRAPRSEPQTLAELALRLEPVLEKVGPCTLIGHSMGGVLAVMIAERFGADRVVSVVNVEGNLSPGDCQYSGRVAGCTEREFLNWGRRELLDGLYHQGVADEAHRGYYASMRLAEPGTVYQHSRDLVEISTTEEMVGRMTCLEVPTYYLAGVPNGVCERSLQLLSESTLSHDLIEPSGHWPFIDQPAAFAERLASWLDRVG